MSLQITQPMLDKVNYFLRAFPTKEWSGPAWYLAADISKQGFPEDFILMDFHPLDLGDTASTEWDSDDFAKILKTKYKKDTKLKKCYIGLLHSHHNMGAFFSGTDTGTLEEMAPEKGFYPSLVVSTKADKQFAFSFSYLDQYGKTTIFTDKVKIEKAKGCKEWEAIAKKIKKDNETAVTTYQPKSGYNGYGGYQGSFGWAADDVVVLEDDKMQKGKDIWSKYRNPQNSMSQEEMIKQMKKIGINNPYILFSGAGYRY
tara:strand:- start:71 stop:841 length:771 start_codon:yes stop_codon:yes gene_type:complete